MSDSRKKSLKNAAEKAVKKGSAGKKTSGKKTAASKGKKIGKYQNAVLLAKGGMGAIYKADHPTLDQPVVLKMLTLTGSDQFTQRFQREATIMMGFQHVNIVNYFDHFKTSRSYCMVMEYVDGCSVAQLLETHRYLDDGTALLILRDTLRALEFAHSRGVVHRDIKPANILISSTGEVKLTDFGIAHDQGVDTDGLTREGMTLGTPSYMAPEQFRDAGTVDARADIYSAGVLLYECLTGSKPFSGSSLPQMLERIRKGRYDRLRKLRPESARICRRLVRKAVRPRPGRRYRDAARMLRSVDAYISRRNGNALRQGLADLVAGKEKVVGTAARSRRKIRRIVIPAVAAAAGLALVGAVWWAGALSGILPSPLMPGFAGAVGVEMAVPEGYDVPPAVVLEVYRADTGDTDTELLRRRRGRFEADGMVVKTLPAALAPGMYDCVVHVGDSAFVHALQVTSLRDRSIAMAGDASPLHILNPPWQPADDPVAVRWLVRDGETGAEVDGAGLASVDGFEGRILPGGHIELPAGETYTFRFEAPGYLDRSVTLTPSSGTGDCRLEILMSREPAILRLSSDLPFRRPRMDGGIRYRHGGSEGGFRVLPMLENEPVDLILLPGEYLLTCGGESRQASLRLELAPGEEMSLSLEKSEQGEFLWNEVVK